MNSQERKLQQRIARRKEKVQRLIGQQEAYLSALDPVNYRRRRDYLRVLSQSRNKLNRLKRELLALEAGQLPGAWVEHRLEE
ncbi:MAG: hypothetical protein AVO34_04975 [Firmicutes bacterium ML8_F2]|jgi:hypothetical protein|nr:MAG: hypothetical protein AVO34_04975 [Firmicutes bacterium ML8_F2]